MEDKACPQCNFTLQKLQDVRRLGCAHCFIHFSKELKPAIAGIQKDIQHIGRQPQVNIKSQIEKLQGDLNIAIEKEAYEEASIIKQQLSILFASV